MSLPTYCTSQAERVAYNALPAELTGGKFDDEHGGEVMLTQFGRYVAPAVQPTAEPSCVEEYDTVRALRTSYVR